MIAAGLRFNMAAMSCSLAAVPLLGDGVFRDEESQTSADENIYSEERRPLLDAEEGGGVHNKGYDSFLQSRAVLNQRQDEETLMRKRQQHQPQHSVLFQLAVLTGTLLLVVGAAATTSFSQDVRSMTSSNLLGHVPALDSNPDHQRRGQRQRMMREQAKDTKDIRHHHASNGVIPKGPATAQSFRFSAALAGRVRQHIVGTMMFSPQAMGPPDQQLDHRPVVVWLKNMTVYNNSSRKGPDLLLLEDIAANCETIHSVPSLSEVHPSNMKVPTTVLSCRTPVLSLTRNHKRNTSHHQQCIIMELPFAILSSERQKPTTAEQHSQPDVLVGAAITVSADANGRCKEPAVSNMKRLRRAALPRAPGLAPNTSSSALRERST